MRGFGLKTNNEWIYILRKRRVVDLRICNAQGNRGHRSVHCCPRTIQAGDPTVAHDGQHARTTAAVADLAPRANSYSSIVWPTNRQTGFLPK